MAAAQTCYFHKLSWSKKKGHDARGPPIALEAPWDKKKTN
jgi:hypothetical protein